MRQLREQMGRCHDLRPGPRMERFSDRRCNNYLGGRGVQTGACMVNSMQRLSGMYIIKRLDLTVNFGRNQFKVGQSGWEMMTFSEKHLWVFL